MSIKKYNPTSAGRRISSVSGFDDITAKKPAKSLVYGKRSQGGRNNRGVITVRHQGGGVKQAYRFVDFNRDKFDIPGLVTTIEYDPNRNCRIALVVYKDGEKRYIVAPQELKVGMEVISSQTKDIKAAVGNSMPLAKVPQGAFIYNVELKPGSGGKIARSAGNAVQLIAVEGDYAAIRLPSGEMRRVSKDCLATIGSVSNPDFMNIRFGKAGRMRYRGIRPTVRGKAMNPVDHPHGGGEARNPIGLKFPKTPWGGKHALGVPTRKPSKYSDHLIISRRKK